MTAPPLVRRFRPGDAAATHAVFFAAVRIGAAGHYRTQQLIDWAPSREIPQGWGAWLDRNITFIAETGGVRQTKPLSEREWSADSLAGAGIR